MKGVKRSRSEGKNGRVVFDPDLVCAVCTDLVVDARQVGCCGSIFCRSCIVKWLSQQKPGSCPFCRADLAVRKLIVDKRSERQSADHPRNCQFYERHGCQFIGGLKAVTEHQKCCSFNPDICKNAYCRTLHDLEANRQLRGKQQDESFDQKKVILATVWKTPEEALRALYDLHIVTLFTVSGAGCDGAYQQFFSWNEEEYTCVVDCRHHNVSIVCSAEATATRNRTLRFVLIHPTDPALNHAIDISVPKKGSTAKRGNLNWMTEEKFRSFVVNSKFALGLKTIPYVPVA